MSEFTHLHLHTTYSLLDGAIRIPKLVDRLAGAGMSACAMTDHGNLFGAVEFYKAMKRNGMKPIIGCEGYVAPKGRKDRSKRLSYHMVFLAENQTGYRNLMYLVSMGYKEGFYYNPRVDKELLRKHSEGIIATSACLGGELAQLILAGRIDEAREAAREYKSIFAPGRYFLEIQENKLPEQQRVNEVLLDFSKELDIPLVATNDSHYLQEEDAEAHDVLLCIQTRKKITDEDRLKHPHSVYYVRTPEEIAQLFSYAPEAVANTMRIAEMCNVELSLNKDVYLPEFPVPSGETVESYLRKQAREGLDARLRDLPYRVDREAYRKRLERELEVIVSMGFSGYFLIVADFIQFAKRHQIPVGPGRGSGAGSLVAYALRITDLDPIRYNLIFERFLNPERVSMPDFDVDFCMYRRGEVIDYVKRKYGPDHVCGIIAMSTLKAKGVIRDVARAMGFSVSEGDRIARLIPEPKMQGQNVSIAQALEEEPRLREEMARNPQVRKLIEYAQALEGLNRHAGCHAAGIVISDVPIWERVPIYRMNDGTIVTQFDKNMAEEVGLVKFDFLGLTTLTIIDTAVRLINRHRKEPIDISKIPIDDPKVYELISSGDTDGIFQLETSGLTDLMKKLKPSRFEDIIASIALYRPGPMALMDDFVARRHGRQPITYDHPKLEPILKDTYGICIYQEQVMRMASDLAGYSMGQADILRKAMGKKKPEVMAQQRSQFVEGCVKNGIDEQKANELFDMIARFAGYAFNLSHSAAYAMVTYQTAWLKTHYPVEFLAAILSVEKEKSDKVSRYIAEAKRKGIEILPPDVNESDLDFTVVGGKIRFGLGAIKNVGESAISSILEARNSGGAFTSLSDFCQRVDTGKVNRKVIECLIRCGAFDSLKLRRAQLWEILDSALSRGQARKKERESGQLSLFGQEQIEAEDPIPEVEEWGVTERLSAEKELLGFYVTGHPLDRYAEEIALHATANTGALERHGDGEIVTLGGMITALKEKTTTKGKRMAFFTLEDLYGSTEIVVFSEVLETCIELLRERRGVVVVTGKVQYRNESLDIVAERIVPLEEAHRRRNVSLHLQLDHETMTRERIGALKETLAAHPGGFPVSLHIVRPGHSETIVRLPERFHVTPSDAFREEMIRFLGRENLKFQTAVSNPTNRM